MKFIYYSLMLYLIILIQVNLTIYFNAGINLRIVNYSIKLPV